MSGLEVTFTAILIAAVLVVVSVFLWPGEAQREAGQHAAPRSMIVDVAAEHAAAAVPPPGYVEPDTDTWLTRPRATGAYGQLAPAALDAAADTMPPGAVATVHAAPVAEPLAPLPPWAAAGVWSPRLMSPGPEAAGRHRADGPDPAQWLADLDCSDIPVVITAPSAPEPATEIAEPEPEPLAAEAAPEPEITVPAPETAADDAISATWQRATDLPDAVYAQLGGLTPAQYIDELFGSDTGA